MRKHKINGWWVSSGGTMKQSHRYVGIQLNKKYKFKVGLLKRSITKSQNPKFKIGTLKRSVTKSQNPKFKIGTLSRIYIENTKPRFKVGTLTGGAFIYVN